MSLDAPPRLTRHARVRMSQRAAGPDLVNLALRYGRLLHRGGDEVYLITDRSLAGTPHERDADRLRGLCVVITSGGVVRTVMWRHRTRHRPGLLRRARMADEYMEPRRRMEIEREAAGTREVAMMREGRGYEETFAIAHFSSLTLPSPDVPVATFLDESTWSR